eukprot:g17422.t1
MTNMNLRKANDGGCDAHGTADGDPNTEPTLADDHPRTANRLSFRYTVLSGTKQGVKRGAAVAEGDAAVAGRDAAIAVPGVGGPGPLRCHQPTQTNLTSFNSSTSGNLGMIIDIAGIDIGEFVPPGDDHFDTDRMITNAWRSSSTRHKACISPLERGLQSGLVVLRRHCIECRNQRNDNRNGGGDRGRNDSVFSGSNGGSNRGGGNTKFSSSGGRRSNGGGSSSGGGDNSQNGSCGGSDSAG